MRGKSLQAPVEGSACAAIRGCLSAMNGPLGSEPFYVEISGRAASA